MKPVDILFPEAKKAKDAGLCPTCAQPIGVFKDNLSRTEFGISGMCQACQDSVFCSPEEETMESTYDTELQDIRRGVERDYKAGNSPNSQRAIKEAEENDLNVVFPADNQLQIDIDSARAQDIFDTMLPIVEQYYGIIRYQDAPSRSGLPKRHITLTLRKSVTPYERIALQLALGSDRVREILGVVQQMLGDPHPTLFLEKKS